MNNIKSYLLASIYGIVSVIFGFIITMDIMLFTKVSSSYFLGFFTVAFAIVFIYRTSNFVETKFFGGEKLWVRKKH